MASTLSPAAEEARRHEYTRFVEGVARLAPLHVRISMGPTDGNYCVDTGVWARRCRPGAAAPSGAGPVNAVLFITSKFPARDVRVAADERATRILTDALEQAAQLEPAADRATAQRLQRCAGEPVARSTLDSLAHLLRHSAVTVTHDPTVTYDDPVGHPAPRMRFGRRAEGAYHELCRTHGYTLISADGAALRPTDGRSAACGWAWWETPDRWAAGGHPDGTSRDGEFTAALEALRAHPDERIAVTYDYSGIGRVVTAAAGLWTGGTSPVELNGLAGELHDACRNRQPDTEVLWLPISAKSSSPRHQIVDRIARSARIATSRGHHGPWGPHRPIQTAA